MRRAIFQFFNTVSILLLAASLTLCIYGVFQGRLLMRQQSAGAYGVGTTEGWAMAFSISMAGNIASPDAEWKVEDLSKKDIDQIGVDLQPTTFKIPGFTLYLLDSTSTAPMPLTGWVVAIHFGWLIPMFAILPAYWLLTRKRDPRRRLKMGLCVKCGYDLRGSPSGACPECGELVPNRPAVDANHTPHP